MNAPPWVGDPSALVLVDWSWWLNRAFHGRDGLEGMMSLMVGWLTGMLAYEPAHLAIALDSPGPTWRHRVQHPTDPEWRYKAHRSPKPDEFFAIGDRCTRLAELHGIPVLFADGYEADDVLATACAQGRGAGYRVWIASADKDLHQLVEADDRSGLFVGMWNPFPSDPWHWRGPPAVREAFGVEPAQIADWLAISGDTSDGVPGIGHDIGAVKAAALLAEHRTLAGALAAPVWSSTKEAEIEAEVKALAKGIAKSRAAAKKGLPASSTAEAEAKREALMQARKVARWHLTLVANRALALFSRELTALDCDAPVDLPWEELPLGGYRVEELRKLYTSLGFTRKAAEVPYRRKLAPWRMPWSAESAQPKRQAAPPVADRRAPAADPTFKAFLDEGDAMGEVKYLCAYSGCATDDRHCRARALVEGIASADQAPRAIAAIRKLGLVDAAADEHCEQAIARWRDLEGRAA